MDDVALSDLARVVHDILVVHQCVEGLLCLTSKNTTETESTTTESASGSESESWSGSSTSHLPCIGSLLDFLRWLIVLNGSTKWQAIALWSHNSFFLEVRSLHAATLNTVEARIKLFNVLCSEEILLFAQSDVTKKQQAALGATRILHALVEHVCEVQALAKHEAVSRCLRWCDAHALGQKAEEVGQIAAVEEELTVANVSCDPFKGLGFSLPLNLEDLDGLDTAALSGVQAVGANEVAFRVALDERLNLDSHAVVNILHWMHRELTIKSSQEES